MLCDNDCQCEKKILYFLHAAIEYSKAILPISTTEKNFACMTELWNNMLCDLTHSYITNFWPWNCIYACSSDLLVESSVKF